MQVTQMLQNFATQQTAKRPSYTKRLMKRVRYDDSRESKRKCATVNIFSLLLAPPKKSRIRARTLHRRAGLRYNHETGSWG